MPKSKIPKKMRFYEKYDQFDTIECDEWTTNDKLAAFAMLFRVVKFNRSCNPRFLPFLGVRISSTFSVLRPFSYLRPFL